MKIYSKDKIELKRKESKRHFKIMNKKERKLSNLERKDVIS